MVQPGKSLSPANGEGTGKRAEKKVRGTKSILGGREKNIGGGDLPWLFYL